MTPARWTLLVTGSVVALLAAVLTIASWDDANKVATVASALATVAALGVAIWSALRAPTATRTVRRTGDATSGHGGRAVSGAVGRPAGAESLRVENTGLADASRGGHAVSGADATSVDDD